MSFTDTLIPFILLSCFITCIHTFLHSFSLTFCLHPSFMPRVTHSIPATSHIQCVLYKAMDTLLWRTKTPKNVHFGAPTIFYTYIYMHSQQACAYMYSIHIYTRSRRVHLCICIRPMLSVYYSYAYPQNTPFKVNISYPNCGRIHCSIPPCGDCYCWPSLVLFKVYHFL